MKTLKLIKTGLAVISLTILAASCKPEPPTPPSPPLGDKCENVGKFYRDVCLPSIFNGYVILDEKNNRYLAPCESEVPIPMHIEPNEEVYYEFEEIDMTSECEKQIICHAIPDKPYKFVKITCLKRNSIAARD